jgi:AraC family transcriptional regulator
LSGPGFDYKLPFMTTPAKTYDVRIEKFPPRRVAYMRHIGPYMEVGPTFQKFMAWAGAHGLFGPNTLVLGIGHDNPATTPAEKLRYDACVTVDDNFKPEGEVGVQTLAGGEYGVARLRGSYEELALVYHYLFEIWLPTSGRVMAPAPPFEIYVNSPAMVPEEDLLTDVCVLLK